MLVSSAAYAHTGIGHTAGFTHGFVHPISGIDHVLAMIAVGLFAAQLGGRALWLVPASFVGMMAGAGVLGAAGVQLPFAEVGIAISVVALGLIVAFHARPPVAMAMALVAFFALFHGHAHGAEIPENASGLTYGVGFIAATTLLHAVGIGIGLAVGGLPLRHSERLLQLCGGAISLVGAAILFGMI